MEKNRQYVLSRLRSEGLLVLDPPSEDKPSPQRFRVASSEARNKYEGHTDADEIKVIEGYQLLLTDCDGTQWHVDGVSHVGGFGPGDFGNMWNSADGAIEDVLDFFQGSPIRRHAKDMSKKRKPDTASALQQDAQHLITNVLKELKNKGLVNLVPLNDSRFPNGTLVTAPSDRGHSVSIRVYSDGTLWCVDGRTNLDTLGTELLHGEFFNEWSSPDQVVADLTDFWSPTSIRRRAWEQGKLFLATAT